jgi:phosphate transport system substrate-binding protein
MEAVLQRPPLRAGELELRPSEFLVLVNGERLHLTVRELELLTALMERRDRIVTREELYREVWGEPYRKSDRSVDVYGARFTSFLQAGDDSITDSRPSPKRVSAAHERPQGENRMRKLLTLVACGGLLAFGAASCGGDDDDSATASSGGGGSSSGLSGEIAGAGSSAQEAAQEAFIANFQKSNSDVTISYDPVGSGGGREQFISGGVAYAGSDSPLATDEQADAKKRCKGGDVVQVPDYVSPIAVVYNLNGVDSLKLSPETVAGIFAQKIKNWNDPKIKADNPGVDLPSTRITPVNRSDDSGTTANFTDYLSKTAGGVWTSPPDDTWPIKGGEAAEGTSGVVEAVGAGDGAVGYADASQAGDLGVAKLKVGDEYVAPSAAEAAKVLELSPTDKKLSDGKHVFAFAIDRTTTKPGTYPNILVSYLIGCTRYDGSTGAIVHGFFDYAISSEGQAAAAKNAGSAPLTDSLRSKIQPAVDAIR